MLREQVSRVLGALPRLRRETVWWAVREISIVVAGVLIAFALNAWWIEREALRNEQVHLRSLVTDFERNVGSLQALIQRQERVAKASVDLLRLARTERATSSDRIRPLRGQVLSSVRFEPVMRAYDALLNSAGLTLIRDDEPRSSRAAFAARLNGRDSERVSDELYFSLIRDFAGRLGIGDEVLADRKASTLSSSLLADAKFQEYLALRHTAESAVASQYRGFLGVAETVLAELRSQVK
jgi:hypothetical protein